MDLKKNFWMATAIILTCIAITSAAFASSLPTVSVATGTAKNTAVVTADTGSFESGDVVRVFIKTKKGTADWETHWSGKTDVTATGTSVTVALLMMPSMDGVTKVKLLATISRAGQTNSSEQSLSKMPVITATPTGSTLKVIATSGTFFSGDNITVTLNKKIDGSWNSSQIGSTSVTSKTTEATVNADITALNTEGATEAKVVVTVKRGDQRATFEQSLQINLPANEITAVKDTLDSGKDGDQVSVKATSGAFLNGDKIQIYLITTQNGTKSSRYWGDRTVRSSGAYQKRVSFYIPKNEFPSGAEVGEAEATLIRNGAEIATAKCTLFGTPVTPPVTPPGGISTPPATTPPPVSTPAPGEMVTISKQVSGRTITVSATSGQFYKSSDQYMIYIMAANGTTQTVSPASIEDGTSFEATVPSEINISEGSIVMIGILRYNNGIALSYGIPIQ